MFHIQCQYHLYFYISCWSYFWFYHEMHTYQSVSVFVTYAGYTKIHIDVGCCVDYGSRAQCRPTQRYILGPYRRLNTPGETAVLHQPLKYRNYVWRTNPGHATIREKACIAQQRRFSSYCESSSLNTNYISIRWIKERECKKAETVYCQKQLSLVYIHQFYIAREEPFKYWWLPLWYINAFVCDSMINFEWNYGSTSFAMRLLLS